MTFRFHTGKRMYRYTGLQVLYFLKHFRFAKPGTYENPIPRGADIHMDKLGEYYTSSIFLTGARGRFCFAHKRFTLSGKLRWAPRPVFEGPWENLEDPDKPGVFAHWPFISLQWFGLTSRFWTDKSHRNSPDRNGPPEPILATAGYEAAEKYANVVI